MATVIGCSAGSSGRDLRTHGLEGVRPAAVLLDHFVDLAHDADGLVEGDDDLLVVGEDLVAADVEVPHFLWQSPKAAGLRLTN